MAHSYEHPMHSVGVGVIFYYQVEDQIYLLLQRRSAYVSTAPNKVGITGGYLDAKIKKNDEPENIIDGLWREIEEEMGKKFVNDLPQTAFSPMNVAYVRHNAEPNKLNGGFQSNIHNIWLLKITKDVADLAYPADEREVSAIEHVKLEDISKVRPCRWLPGLIDEFVRYNKICVNHTIDDTRCITR